MSITNSLPIELWEKVAYCIPSTRDLLSLALVSRLFSSFIIPYHLPYRHIRCDIRRKDIWEHLATNPRYTRGIRTLVVYNNPDCYSADREYLQLPTSLIKPMNDLAPFDPSILPALLKSLWHMTTLEKFGLNWVFGSERQGLSNVVDISRVLADRATCLRGLTTDLKFVWRENRQHEIVDYLDSFSMWQLSNLTQVRLSHLCESAEMMLIVACPNLEDLCLSLYDTRASRCPLIFHQGNWKKLRRLTLLGAPNFLPPSFPEEAQPIAANFFQRHASLECLLVYANFSPPFLPDSSLPMLRSFSWHTYTRTSNLSSFLSKSALSRLIHCETHIELFDSAARMENLEDLQIALSSDLSIGNFSLKNAPNLRKLQFIGRLPRFLIASLVSCCLTSGVTHVFLDSVSTTNIEKVLREFSKIKTLRYIQLFKNSIEIDRDSDGNYLGYHAVLASQLGEDPSQWRNFFCG